MEQLYAILEKCCPTIDFHTENKLITDKLIDSIDLVSIIAEIEDAFNVSIDVEDIDPSNFDSAEKIWELINRL